MVGSYLEKAVENVTSVCFESDFSGAAFCLPHQLVGFLLLFICFLFRTNNFSRSKSCCEPDEKCLFKVSERVLNWLIDCIATYWYLDICVNLHTGTYLAGFSVPILMFVMRQNRQPPTNTVTSRLNTKPTIWCAKRSALPHFASW